MSGTRAIIAVTVDIEEIHKLLYKLEPKQQNKALRAALRKTAEQARNRLAKKAQASYTIKNAGFKRAMRINASASSAVIRSEGTPLPLKDFKTSKSGNTLRAQVVKSGSLKELNRGGIKAFMNNIAKKGQTRKKDSVKGKAGSSVRHLAVAQRKGKKRVEVNEKFSNSIPAMIGSSKHVYGLIEPYIARDLQDNLKQFIDQALGGTG